MENKTPNGDRSQRSWLVPRRYDISIVLGAVILLNETFVRQDLPERPSLQIVGAGLVVLVPLAGRIDDALRGRRDAER